MTFTRMTPRLAWVLGVIYGDGSLDKKGNYVRVFSGDEDVLQNIQSVFGGLPTISRGRGKTGIIGLNSRRLWAELVEIGLMPNKAYRMAYPNLPAHLEPHFVRGLLDSDGCWSSRVGPLGNTLIFVYVSTSRKFVESLRLSLIKHVGVSQKATVRISNLAGERLVCGRMSKCRESYRLSYYHEDCIALGKWMYQDSSDARCERKYARWVAISTTPLGRKTKTENEAIVRRYLSGESVTRIARDIGTDESSLCKLLKVHGVVSRSKSERHFKQSAPIRDAVYQRVSAGESVVAMADEFHWDLSSVYRYLRSRGLRLGKPRVAGQVKSG